MSSTIGQFISNHPVLNNDSETIDIINPATAETIGQLQFATETDVSKAIASAEEAAAKWAQVPPLKRARVLFKFKALLETHQDELAAIVTKEHGKIFEDRTLRQLLYRFLDAPPTVRPQAAAAGAEDADVRVGVSLSQQIYTAEDVLRISLSYDQAVSDLVEVLTLTYLNRETGEPDPDVPVEHINVSLTGAHVHRVSFSTTTPRRPGFYRLTTATAADDPLPTVLIIRGSADDA